MGALVQFHDDLLFLDRDGRRDIEQVAEDLFGLRSFILASDLIGHEAIERTGHEGAMYIREVRLERRQTPVATPPGSSCLQRLPKVPPQRIEVNVFDGRLNTGVPILPGAPGRRAHWQPVGRPIGRAWKTIPLHKGFQQRNAMPILGLPVAGEPAADLAQYSALVGINKDQVEGTALFGDDLG